MRRVSLYETGRSFDVGSNRAPLVGVPCTLVVYSHRGCADRPPANAVGHCAGRGAGADDRREPGARRFSASRSTRPWARLQQANIGPNPVLDLAINDSLGTDDFRGVRNAETTVSIIWVLERGIRRRQVDAALVDVSLHELEARIMRLDAAAETARRFLACLAYQARLVNAAEAIRVAEETVDAVRARVAAGGATQAELSRAEAGLVRARLLEEDYTHELLAAYHRLSAQWGDTEPDFKPGRGKCPGAADGRAAGGAIVPGWKGIPI